MNNPTEDEKKALANAWKAERKREWQRKRRLDPAYRERDREGQRKRALDPSYRELKRERQRKRRLDPAYRERQRERVLDPASRERRRERERKRRLDPAYRERERDRKYGLAPGQWDAEFDRLLGVCPIDGRRMVRKAVGNPPNLAVTDHDHKTKKFRGIICNHCNKNLTKSWCNPQVLRNALAYLKRTGQDPDAPTQGTLL